MAENIANDIETTLNGAINSSVSSITVTSSSNFPVTPFRAVLYDPAIPNTREYIRVTNVSGTTWTVTRAVEDSTRFPAVSWSSGVTIAHIITAAGFAEAVLGTLGYTPANKAGDTFSGGIAVSTGGIEVTGNSTINGALTVIASGVTQIRVGDAADRGGGLFSLGSQGVLYLTGNTVRVTGAWNRINIANPSLLFSCDPALDAWVWQSAASGANPISAFTEGMRLDRASGQLRLPITGSSAGLLIGGDVLLYRDGASTFHINSNFISDGYISVTNAVPRYIANDTDAAADAKKWDLLFNNGTLSGRVISDDESAVASWISVVRSGATISSITMPLLTVSGALTGTLATAAQPNVTSVGTLTSLNVSGAVTIGTNLIMKLNGIITTDASTNTFTMQTGTADQNSFFYFMPKGTPASGSTELAVFSTDFIANNTNWEGLFISKTVSGVGMINVTKGGTGTYRNLELWTSGAASAVLTTAGQLQIPTTGSSAGVLIGGDVQLYRSAANVLTIPDAVTVGAALELDGTTGYTTYRTTAGSIYKSTSGGGAYPFLESNNLIIQGYNLSTFDRDIVFATGNTPVVRMIIGRTGLVSFPVVGATAGISIGGDVQLYRSAVNELTIPDKVIISGFGLNQTTTDTSGSIINSFQGITLFTATSSTLSSFVVRPSDDSNPTQEMFILQNAAGSAYVARFLKNGQLQLITAGSSGGIVLGADATLYRGAANVLQSGSSFISGGYVQLGAIAGNPGTLAVGQNWYNSTQKSQRFYVPAGVIGQIGSLYQTTADATAITGVTAETLMNQSYAIAAGSLTAGKYIRVLIRGRFTTAATPGNAVFKLKLGPATNATSGTTVANLTVALTASLTNAAFTIEATIAVRSTTTTWAQGTGYFATTAASPMTAAVVHMSNPNLSTATTIGNIDSTAHTVHMTIQPGATTVSVTITQMIVELID